MGLGVSGAGGSMDMAEEGVHDKAAGKNCRLRYREADIRSV